MFLLTGLIGKGVGASSFGSSIATGQAAATAMYSGHLSWWSSIWMNLTGGIPAWVSIAGAASGFVAALMIAPLFSPWLEIGSKYPPAKPGALCCEPLKAVKGVANAAPI